MTAVDLYVLGPVEVVHQGRQVSVGGPKQRAILAILAIHANRVVPTSHLIDALWGNSPPRQPLHALHVSVSKLRSAIKAFESNTLLQTTGGGYRLVISAENLDLLRFEERVLAGREALKHNPTTARTALTEALGLWRGSPLAEFGHKHLEEGEVRRLEESRLWALALRIDADIALGRYVEVVRELQLLVTQYNLNERLQYQLLLCLYRTGRTTEALERYRNLRQQLVDELGIEPSLELQSLHNGILTQTAHSADAGQAATVSGPEASLLRQGTESNETVERASPVRLGIRQSIWNIPPRNPYFVGRDDVLGELKRRISTEADHVVQTLYGLGGIGKTQLAIEFAHRQVNDYPIAWWIHAENPALIPDQLIQLGDEMHLWPEPSLTRSVQHVLNALSTTTAHWLLVFDNAEHPSIIAKYRPRGTGSILITSRYSTWGQLGGRMEINEMARHESTKLLSARVPMDSRIADQLSDELGDLPLAIAQAAAYLEETGSSPAAYLRQFRDRRVKLLRTGFVVDYDERIDTAWDMTLVRINTICEPAARLIQLCSFMSADPIPEWLLINSVSMLPQEFACVASDGDVLDENIGVAAAFSMIRRCDVGAFQMHRLVQAVVRSRIVGSERVHFLDAIAEILWAALPGAPDVPMNWPRYAQLVPHVLAVGSVYDDHPKMRQALLAAVNYLQVRGDTLVSLNVLRELTTSWTEKFGFDNSDTLSAAGRLTLSLLWVGEAPEAVEIGRKTFDRLNRSHGERHSQSLAAGATLALALAWTGAVDEAHTIGIRIRTVALDTLGSEHPVSLLASANLINVKGWSGDIRGAVALGEETFRIAERVLGGNHFITLGALTGLGFALAWRGDCRRSQELHLRALDVFKQQLGDDHPTTLRLKCGLGFAMAWQKDLYSGWARDTLDQCQAVLGANHRITMVARSVVALESALWGTNENAIQACKECLVLDEAVLGPEHPITLLIAGALAVTMARDRADAGSEQFVLDVVSRSRVKLGRRHPITMLAEKASLAYATAAGQSGAHRSQEELEVRAYEVLGPNNPLTLIGPVGS